MDIKKVLYSVPPRISARVIAAALALLLALLFGRIFFSLQSNESENESSENSGEDITASTGQAGSGSDTEAQKHFVTDNAVSVGTVINARNAVLCSLNDSNVIAQKEMLGSVSLKDATVFMVALTASRAVSEGRITLTEEAVCPASAATSPGYSLSSQVLPIGKRMQVGDILKCMLYQSGTSYAYTLAVHISGSTEAFTAEMTQHATSLGLTSTVFTSCTGDTDPCSVVSAYDFAVIMKHFLSDTYLRGILCSDDMVTVGYGQGTSIELVVKNDFFESFCTDSQAKNDGIIGGRVSKQSYLSWACVIFIKNGNTYISAVFESEDPFSDALMLYSAYALCA